MYNTPYNAPFAGNYGAYSPAPPMQPAPQPVYPQPQQERRQTNAEWIPVSSVQQAREHIVQPNQILYFMNNNKPEFYAKSSDNFGTTAFKAFRFEEINPDAVQPMPAETAQRNTEIERMNERITAIEARLSAITGGAAYEPDYADDERKPRGGDPASH